MVVVVVLLLLLMLLLLLLSAITTLCNVSMNRTPSSSSLSRMLIVRHQPLPARQTVSASFVKSPCQGTEFERGRNC